MEGRVFAPGYARVAYNVYLEDEITISLPKRCCPEVASLSSTADMKPKAAQGRTRHLYSGAEIVPSWTSASRPAWSQQIWLPSAPHDETMERRFLPTR